MPATAQTEPTPSAPTSAPGEPAPPRPDDAAAPAPERDIIVTGTRITRPNNHSAAPVTTVTSTDIAAQGATTIEEVLNRLPQVQANAEQNYGESEGRQRIKLRSLGFERTLTLVDGLRLGLQNGMDVGIIPNALIDRIDVLSGGASSVYGSDAVSGVVNFILKKDFDGIRLEGGYSFFDHVNRANAVTEAAARADFPWPHGRTADGGRANVSLAAGHQWLDGALRLSAFAGYRHSDQVSLMDRSLSACEVSQKLSTGRLTCTRSTYTATGTVVPGGIGQGRTLVNDPLGAGTFVPFASGRGTAANPFDELPFQRHFDRINTGVFVSADMSDEVELYATALFYRDQSYNTVPTRVYSYSAYGKEPYHTNCDNPFLSTPQRIALCGAATSGLVPLDVRYRFDGLPPTRLRFEDQGVRVTGGLRGRVLDGAWGYDLSGVYSLLKARAIYPAQPDEKRVNRALNVVAVNGVPTCAAALDGTDKRCVPFNAFAPYNSDARVPAYLFTRTDGTEGDLGRLWQGLAVLNGDLGRYGITSPLAEQGVALALGAEARAEHFGTRADRQFRQTNGGRDQHFTQRIYEVNAEAQVPVIEHQRFTDLLQLNGGYRVSRYDRLRGRFTTWKGEGVWQPIADIGLRGSINKAQRAPTVIEADQASNIYYDTIGPNDPCASTPDPNTSDPNARLAPTASLTQCRRTGLPDRLYGSASLSCLNEACTVRSGGFDLKPETAYTKTFGVILRPRALKGLTLSVDRFVIHLTDSINYFAVADFLSGCLTTGLDYYCRGVRRAPDTYRLDSAPGTKPTSGYLVRGTGNGYRSQSSGWDVQAQFGLGLGGAGRLDLSLNGSLVTRVGVHDSPDSRPRNCVGYYGGSCGESMPRWSHGAGATWASPGGAIHLGTNWRHIGAMAIAYNAPERTGIPADEAQFRHFYTGVPTYDYVDLSSSFEIGKVYTLRFSVNNLLDRDPPLLPDSRSTLGLLRGNTLFRYDLLGRQLAASVSMKL
ncbi:TonB-dependent receptor [Sphingomonas yunnanensis]|nr:TonB-dependent receptor [Sphingomonas yunnanensis]